VKSSIKKLLIIGILFLTGCGVSRQNQIEQALALTPDHFKRSVTIKDDPLDLVVTFSTVEGFKARQGLLGVVGDDNFLRGFVNRKTGERRFQVYNTIYYGGNWKFFNYVNYETPNGPRQKALTILDRQVTSCSRNTFIGCGFNEHVAFDVEESLLRTMSRQQNNPGEPAGWSYKLSARDGTEYKDGILAAEILGLLMRMDEYRGSVSPERQPDSGPTENCQDPAVRARYPIMCRGR
jgi:hypothetical protein